MMQAKRRVVLELELDEVWIFLIDGGNAMVVSSGHNAILLNEQSHAFQFSFKKEALIKVEESLLLARSFHGAILHAKS